VLGDHLRVRGVGRNHVVRRTKMTRIEILRRIRNHRGKSFRPADQARQCADPSGLMVRINPIANDLAGKQVDAFVAGALVALAAVAAALALAGVI